MPQHDLMELAINHFQVGGSTMVPLTILSLLMWTLAIAKLIRFLRERLREATPEQCLEAFANGDGSRLARWQWDILCQFMRERCDDPDLNRKMLAALRAKQADMARRHIGTIILVAVIAPLLGLLGTVSGMITTFEAIAQFGTGNARALASGISAALITTQSGLVVAVPGLVLGCLLMRRAQKLGDRMELFCIRLLARTE
ncbi:MotA/TolQ/ExbB proton channel family protein [Pseudodesulfovibrio sp. F-1]|uniref:MotA/TolQ/ExbB proton channel family protein n=1 Tax=Pseudodesulfovibrio alkaliphilus TaxID=2661613 RepID=A0A7K1KMD1_9BACT|nr:MotA/TolQ/ExbB proton channel family protein [Pseudodesulfovibrio alkaliphilus]MUM77200.1 MotA/TolQ/ExbB proton channel family protein [Pseudodesulfovibrio alkaliphilus]